MNVILVILAMAFCMGAVTVGSTTKDGWKNTAITWALLIVGIVLFGIAITF